MISCLLKIASISALLCLSLCLATIDSSAQTWSTPINISNTSESSEYSDIAIDHLGNVHVVWSDRTPGNVDIFYSRWDGTGWSKPINISNTVGSSWYPRIAIEPSGNIHVVWSDHPPRAIFYSRWDGISWSKPINISHNAGSSGRPAIAIDQSENIHVVWDNVDEIFYNRWNGTSWANPTNISNTPRWSQFPAIAIDSSGNPHVVWSDPTPGHIAILYSRWNEKNWSNPINISNKSNSHYPTIAMDPLGNIHVSWSGYLNYSGLVYSRWNGKIWTDPIHIVDSGNGSWPAIKIDPSGNLLVVWHAGGANREIFYSHGNGVIWLTPINISKTNLDSSNPAIAMDPLGNIHAVWDDDIQGNREILYSRSLISLAPPSAPNLIEPADGAVLDTFSASILTLQWHHVKDAVLYQVQVAKDEKFTDIVVQSSVKEPKFKVPIGKLTNRQRYFWRVNATGVAATGQWSQTWSFKVNATTNLVKVVAVSSDVSQVVIELRAEKMKNLYGFQIDLLFDPAMLEALEVKEGGFLKTIGGNAFWKPPVIDNRAGTITGILSSRITPGEVEGDGVLATIQFKAKAVGRSVVGFSLLKLADEQANPIVGLPIEGILDITGLSATFFAIPRIENNQIVLDIQGNNVKNVENFALDVQYPNALELIEGKSHIEGGRISDSGVVATLKFKIWESGEMVFNLKNGVLKGPSGITGTPTLLDGKITVVASPAWDVNKDYVVDIFDIVILGINLGTKITGKPRPNPDITGDGTVDLFDFVKVGANFGATYNAKAGVKASPTIVKQHSIALNKELIYQYLSLWQTIYAELEKNPNTNEEFVKAKLLLQELIASVDSLIIPLQTKIMQNYPNPFNPETWIPYQLANAADAIIRIYNVAGRLVRTLNLGRKDVGLYITKNRAAYWDGRNDLGQAVASGLYFYTIQAGDFVATRRMIVVK